MSNAKLPFYVFQKSCGILPFMMSTLTLWRARSPSYGQNSLEPLQGLLRVLRYWCTRETFKRLTSLPCAIHLLYESCHVILVVHSKRRWIPAYHPWNSKRYEEVLMKFSWKAEIIPSMIAKSALVKCKHLFALSVQYHFAAFLDILWFFDPQLIASGL